MKILARHLTIDMYKCKESCFTDMEQLVDKLKTLLAESKLEVVSGMHQLLPDGHAAIMILFNEGHTRLCHEENARSLVIHGLEHVFLKIIIYLPFTALFLS